MTLRRKIARVRSKLALMFRRTGSSRFSLVRSPEGMFIDILKIHAGCDKMLADAGLPTVDAVLSGVRGEVVSESRTSRTTRVDLPSGGIPALFVKVYTFPTPRDVYRGLLRGTLVGRARACREYRVLTKMEEAGVAGVRPIACGTRRKGPFVRAGFVITAASSAQCSPLDRRYAGDLRSKEARALRRQSIEALAQRTRLLHKAGFMHGDLFLRNIVVNCNLSESLRFLDCPNGRISPMTGILRGAAIRDLASLDAGASLLMSRTDRLRFFLAYTQRHDLPPRDRRTIRRILEIEEDLKASEHSRIKDALARANSPSA